MNVQKPRTQRSAEEHRLLAEELQRKANQESDPVVANRLQTEARREQVRASLKRTLETMNEILNRRVG